MRILSGIVLLILSTVSAQAQSWTSQSMRQGAVDYELYAGGGTGLTQASQLYPTADIRFLVLGGRIGRILTREHLDGWPRGNFEYAGEISPLSYVFQPGRNLYGGSFTPVILKWNFTANHKIVPYLLLSGGGLVTTGNVPPGVTSNFNFMAGGSGGVHVFLRPRRALTIETHWLHISNSELGRNNPNLPANFFLTVGYTWFK
jgi:lipid A 3-O-deacylase